MAALYDGGSCCWGGGRAVANICCCDDGCGYSLRGGRDKEMNWPGISTKVS